MQVIIVDDELAALENLENKLSKLPEIKNIKAFSEPFSALSYIKENKVDIAFLDIEMYEISGLMLAKKIKEISYDTNIIFVTGYSNYMKDAFSLRVSGYLTKPASVEQIKEELHKLRCPIKQESKHKLFVRTFGNFEVFYNGEPLKFQYTKTKELFAYLIDRNGALCTSGELMTILWEDYSGNKRSYYSNVLSDLIKTFSGINCSHIITKRRGKLAVIPQNLHCDYYDWLNGVSYSVNSYRGEYMSQYSWSEVTTSNLGN